MNSRASPFPGIKLPFIDPHCGARAALFPLPNNPGARAKCVHIDPNTRSKQRPVRRARRSLSDFAGRAELSVLVYAGRYRRSAVDVGRERAGISGGRSAAGAELRGDRRRTRFRRRLTGVARFSFLAEQVPVRRAPEPHDSGEPGLRVRPATRRGARTAVRAGCGYASVGDPITGPRNTYENNLDVSGSLTWIHGRHELKFGGGYAHDQINVLFGIATNGFFVFAPSPINDAFASFLIGQPVFFLQGGGDPVARACAGTI